MVKSAIAGTDERAVQQGRSRSWIYDMDAHIIDTDEDIRPFLDEHYQKRKGSLLALDEWHRGLIRRPRAPQDLSERLRVLDEEGVICSVLFPSRAMDVNTMRDKAFVAAYCRAYNSFIADVCRKAASLKAMAVLPFDNVSAAVEELTRSVTKLGLVGVVMSSYGLQEHIGSVKYWPIYEEMQRLNVHVGIHNSIQGGPIGDLRADTFMFQHTVGRPAATMTDCAALIYGGVVEKFPRLRVSFLEARVAWVPYWMEYMDRKWEKRRSDAPLLTRKPSEYMTGGNFYYSAEPDEKALPYVLERIGEELIIFASDYPHGGSAFTGDLLGRSDVSERAKTKILRDNGIRLLGEEIDTLAVQNEQQSAS
jgi:predicted TIM-barrel fold metal-dependent hydrolase